jgi:hypothetical protein
MPYLAVRVVRSRRCDSLLLSKYLVMLKRVFFHDGKSSKTKRRKSDMRSAGVIFKSIIRNVGRPEPDHHA